MAFGQPSARACRAIFVCETGIHPTSILIAMSQPHTDAIAGLVELAGSREESGAIPGRFARSTIITLVITSLIAGGLWLAGTFEEEDGLMRLEYFFAAFAGLLVLAALIKLGAEALTISPRTRTTPEKAVSAYLQLIEQRRWKAALSCLSWVAKDGQLLFRPAFPAIDLEGKILPISKGSSLRRYWGPLLPGTRLRGERGFHWTVLDSSPVPPQGARVRVRFSLVLNMDTAAIGGAAWKAHRQSSTADPDFNGTELEFRWPVYQRGGQWYLLSAGLADLARKA
jgi:hypothetical protein